MRRQYSHVLPLGGEIAMMRQKEVNELLHKMTRTADRGKPSLSIETRRQSELMPYMAANVWPGRNFQLVGNSFNAEEHSSTRQFQLRRGACIAMMLMQGKETRRCVYLHEAMNNEGFIEVLSRFEIDWLKRLPLNTVIGPAYDGNGELLSQAFSVWRLQTIASEERMLIGSSRH